MLVACLAVEIIQCRLFSLCTLTKIKVSVKGLLNANIKKPHTHTQAHTHTSTYTHAYKHTHAHKNKQANSHWIPGLPELEEMFLH